MAFELATAPKQTPVAPLAALPQPTKPPPWELLIVADLFLSELASGLFIVSALGDLIAQDMFGPAARIGYIMAFALISADLVCLVADLGDPLRFHHMLRVINLKSPMSVGMWVLGPFAGLSFLCMALAAVNLTIANQGVASARAIIGGIGIVPALFVGGYKGVMLSSTAQPVWKELRWLGAELASSASLLGVAGLMLVALFLPVPGARPGLLLAQKVLLFVSLGLSIEYIGVASLRELRRAKYSGLAKYALLVGVQWVVPLILSFIGGFALIAAASCLILLAGPALRYDLVMLPHWVP